MPHPRAAINEARMQLLHKNYLRVVKGEPPLEEGGEVRKVVLEERQPAAGVEEQLDQQQEQLRLEEVVVQPDELAALRAELEAANTRAEELSRQNQQSASSLQAERDARLAAELLAETLRLAQEDIASSTITDERLREEFSPEELESYGIEQCRMILRTADRTARKNARAEVANAGKTSASTTEAERQRIERDRDSLYYLMIDAAIPDWKKINKDKTWLEWLKAVDPIARVTRQSLLNRARSVYDAAATIDMFNTYKATNKAPASPAPTRVLPTGRAPNATPGNGAEPKGEILTRAWIAEQGNLYSKGKLSREAWKLVESRINSAARENRISA